MPPAPTRTPWFVLSAVLLLTILVYAPFLGNAFVLYDDNTLLVPRTLAQIFAGYDPELYVPLTLLSFQIERMIAGGFHPVVTHGIGLLLHLGNVMLVYSIAAVILKRRWEALVAASLFALHPVNVEAVLWAAARKDVLSTFFALMAIAAYLRSARGESARSHWASVALFLCALLSKVSVAPLPIVLLLIDWLRERPLRRGAVLEKWPYFVLAAIFIAIALVGKTLALKDHSFATLLLVFPKTITFALGKLTVPTGLSVIYQQSTFTAESSNIFSSILALFALFSFLALSFVQRWKTISFGLLFFLVFFLPNIAALQKHGFLHFASDRFAYLPAVGLFLIVAAGAERLMRARKGKIPVLAAVILVLGGFSVLSRNQAAVWRNTQTLFTHTLALYPNAVMARNSLGVALAMEGEHEQALEHFRAAIRLAPWYYLPYFNVGDVLRQDGRIGEAVAVYREAIGALATHGVRSGEDIALFSGLAGFLEENGYLEDAARIRELLRGATGALAAP